MARTTIAKTTLLGAYPTLPLAANSADLAMAAMSGSSGSNGNQIAFGDFRMLLVFVRNSHATNPYTVTFTSEPDPHNRTGDITGYSLAAGDIGVFLFEREGWRQTTDGMLYFEAENAAVLAGCVGIS